MGGVDLQVNPTLDSHTRVFFALYDSRYNWWWPGDTVAAGPWYKVTVARQRGHMQFLVEGVPQIPTNGCEVDSVQCGARASAAVLRNVQRGWVSESIDPAHSPSIEVASVRSQPGGAPTEDAARVSFTRKSAGTDLALYKQSALPLVYAPRQVTFGCAKSGKAMLQMASTVARERWPAIVCDGTFSRTRYSALLSWHEISPTSLSGDLLLRGQAVVVFGQSFSEGWLLRVSGGAVVAHFGANFYANGWLLRGSGLVHWTIAYTPQTAVNLGLLSGTALATGAALLVAVEQGLGRRRRRGRMVDNR
jgi:hypothetical protein